MHNPWRTLPPHVIVEFASLPPPDSGRSDGVSRIVLHDRLKQVERRCTLEHEKVHIERGDMGKCRPDCEADIDRIVARRLVTFDALADALAWSDQIEEVALELWVTPKIARARIAALRPTELAIIAELIADLRAA